MSPKRSAARYKKKSVRPLQQRVFRAITGNRLVYNTCWEDPRIDRKLLEIDRDSRMLVITSAGENAMDYLLDDPASICCVDQNPAQNALLGLKRALFRNGNPELLWSFFGEGGRRESFRDYHRQVRRHLSVADQTWWDRHIDYFSPDTPQGSFYFRGSAGWFAWFLCRRFRRQGLYTDILKLLNARSLREQVDRYNRLEPQLWSPFHRWLMRRDAATSLLGIPRVQRRLAGADGEGLAAFVQRAIRQVFTRVPVGNNYFWRAYLTGSYTPECCPAYLKPPLFDIIRDRESRIIRHTATVAGHLATTTRTYTHFVLLDQMDWLAGDPGAVDRQWRLIQKRAKPGARILFRSAAADPPYLPQWVRERVRFQPTGDLHREDRVGTYGSTLVGILP